MNCPEECARLKARSVFRGEAEMACGDPERPLMTQLGHEAVRATRHIIRCN
jgi:hypothetical protein